jgi:hypothetical protein
MVDRVIGPDQNQDLMVLTHLGIGQEMVDPVTGPELIDREVIGLVVIDLELTDLD